MALCQCACETCNKPLNQPNDKCVLHFCYRHPPEPKSGFKNTGYDWITYETVFNKPQFRKSNQAHELGVYMIPVGLTRIWLRDHVDDATLATLVEAFFPQYAGDIAAVRGFSTHFWGKPTGWKPDPADSAKPPPAPPSAEMASDRGAIRLDTGRVVLMPYNVHDNTKNSRAVGTDPEGSNAYLGPRRLRGTWKFWKTASRSSAARLEPLSREPLAGIAVLDGQTAPWPWPFGEGDKERARLLDPAQYAGVVSGGEALGPIDGKVFSVKTGVIWVGFASQEFVSKDIIGEWEVAAIRSDYAAHIEHTMREATGGLPTDLVLLTELLTIVESKPRPSGHGSLPDGTSIRDLSPMQDGRAYLPPLSLPFCATDLQTWTREFDLIDDAEWCAFWRFHWADAVGKAKALFLLRYGLQHMNPNVQNYLIAFKRSELGKPLADQEQAGIVIRDLQDALLHREVVWARLGGAGLPPTGRTDDDFSRLRALGEAANTPEAAIVEYQFRPENRTLWREESGSTDRQFGPTGTQFGWWRFSAHYNGGRTIKGIPEERQRQILQVLAEWGLAHNASYVRTVENCLGIEIRDIAWNETLLPQRYTERKGDTKAFRYTASELYRVARFSAGTDGPLSVTAVQSHVLEQTKFDEDKQETVVIDTAAREIRKRVLAGDPGLKQDYDRRREEIEVEITDQKLESKNIDSWCYSLSSYPEDEVFEKVLTEGTDAMKKAAVCRGIGLSVQDSVARLVDRRVRAPAGLGQGPAPAQDVKWKQTLEDWEANNATYGRCVTKVRDKKTKLGLALPVDRSSWSEQIRQYARERYDDLDQKHGFTEWNDLDVLKVTGTGLDAQDLAVEVDGYVVKRTFVLDAKNLLVGCERSDSLKLEAADKTLSVRIRAGGHQVSLAPNFSGDLAWEETAVARLHAHLVANAGSIKAYAGNWSVRAPLKTLALDIPSPGYQIVEFEDAGKRWFRPTDSKGKIPCYRALGDSATARWLKRAPDPLGATILESWVKLEFDQARTKLTPAQ